MAINVDDEILQDFLVEAGEILDSLSEQLVELEQRPTDKNLLNSVFRGFHTVKGGAGFLNITPLVDVCHRAEDVFNTLRQGERQVDAALMDVVQKVLDIVNDMMNAVRAGQDPPPASPHMLETLKGLAQPLAPSEKPTDPAQPAPAAPVTHEADEIEKEFEAILAQTQARAASAAAPSGGRGAAAPAAAPAAGGGITEAEFEALLDQLHGKAKAVAAAPALALPCN